MLKVSKSMPVNQTVLELVKMGWVVRTGGRHPLVVSPKGCRIAIPTTPSDHRSGLNFRSFVRRVQGYKLKNSALGEKDTFR